MKISEVEEFVGKYCTVTIASYSWRVKILGIIENELVAFSGKKYRYDITNIQSIKNMDTQEKLFFQEKYER